MDVSVADGRRGRERERAVTWDSWFLGASVVGVASIVFVAGAVAAVAGVFPGPQIGRAWQAAHALYLQQTDYQNVFRSDLWAPERTAGTGVTVHLPGRAQEGVTLYTSADSAAAYLIDMDGNVLHRWHRPFSTVWQPGRGIDDPQPDPFVYFRHAEVMSDGGLLALYEGVGDSPYGYGMVRLDRESNVVWSYLGRAHHQFDVGPDGRIYVLTHAFVDDELPLLGHLERPRLEDFLVILSPEGEELQKIRLLPALSASPYRHIAYTVSGFALGDPLHANSVKVIGPEEAARFPYGEEGQVIMSFREAGGVFVLDPATGEMVWGTRGPWIGQHDADLLPNGHILLFDNYANFDDAAGISRVIEFDPRTMEIVWQYGGTAEAPLESRIRADQQRLANGNTLITESDGGRIVEVTPDGTIVWEFVNPVRGGDDDVRIPIIAWSERLDPAALDPSLLAAGQQAALPVQEIQP